VLTFIEQNIEHKKSIVSRVITAFAQQMCNSDRDAYLHAMHREGGYVTFCKKWYEISGKLKTDEVKALYENGVIPSFIRESISETESKLFGISLINYL
jgi:hypothetical protein